MQSVDRVASNIHFGGSLRAAPSVSIISDNSCKSTVHGETWILGEVASHERYCNFIDLSERSPVLEASVVPYIKVDMPCISVNGDPCTHTEWPE